jgi:hypothetical protein
VAVGAFDPAVFWDAFADVGVLKTATSALDDGSTRDVQVGFISPDDLMLDSQLTVADYQIEYQTADLPDLRRDSQLVIDSVRYRVRRPPRRKDDGYFSVADLEAIR